MQAGWIGGPAEQGDPFTRPALDRHRARPSSGVQCEDDQGEHEAQQGKAFTQYRAVHLVGRLGILRRGGMVEAATGPGRARIVLGVGSVAGDKGDDGGCVARGVVFAVGPESVHGEQAGQDREEQEAGSLGVRPSLAGVFPDHVRGPYVPKAASGKICGRRRVG